MNLRSNDVALRIAVIVAILVAVILGVGSGAPQDYTLTLKTQAVAATGTAVRLSGVATIEGPRGLDLATIEVARAPRPGQRKVVSRSAILSALDRHGVAANTIDVRGAKQCVLTAIGHPVDQKKVERAVRKAIQAAATQVEDVRVTIEDVKLPPNLRVAPGTQSVEVEPPTLRTGVVRVRFSVTSDDADAKPFRSYANVRLTMEGPMLVVAREMRRGERLQAEDIRVETRTIPPGGPWARNADAILGRAARARLKVGRMLRDRDLMAPVAIEVGQPVVATFTKGGVSLRVETVARRRGVVGEIIPVAGIDGRGQLDARIVASGQVLLLGSEPLSTESQP